MSRGLYPAPPNLSRVTVEAAEAFRVIKHGIKASSLQSHHLSHAILDVTLPALCVACRRCADACRSLV